MCQGPVSKTFTFTVSEDRTSTWPFGKHNPSTAAVLPGDKLKEYSVSSRN